VGRLFALATERAAGERGNRGDVPQSGTPRLKAEVSTQSWAALAKKKNRPSGQKREKRGKENVSAHRRVLILVHREKRGRGNPSHFPCPDENSLGSQ